MIVLRKVSNGYVVEPEIAIGRAALERDIKVFNRFSDLVKYLKETLEK